MTRTLDVGQRLEGLLKEEKAKQVEEAAREEQLRQDRAKAAADLPIGHGIIYPLPGVPQIISVIAKTDKETEMITSAEGHVVPFGDVRPNRPPPNGTGPELPVFTPIGYDEIIKQPKKKWLIQDIIGPGDMGQVFGEEGSGKTFVLIDLVFSAISGLPWCQQFKIEKPLTVAYCTGEGRAGIPQRFRAAGEWYTKGKDEIGIPSEFLGPEANPDHFKNLSIFLNVPQLFDRQAETYITQFVSDYKLLRGDHLDLLIIDTQHNATIGSNENDTRDAGHVINAARIATDELGCAIMFAHHANRATSNYRGSSAYAAAMDVMLECAGKKNPRKLKCSKAKDAERFEPLEFLLEADGDLIHVYWNGDVSEGDNTYTDELIAEMKSRPGTQLTAKQWGDAIGIPQKEALRLFASLVQEGSIKRDLQDPDKKKSRYNPWVFWIESQF